MDKKPEGIRGEVDRRILDKMLVRREISPEEMKKYTDSLPDVSENAEEIVIEMIEKAEEVKAAEEGDDD
jgi:hypothetical protein